LHPKRKNGLLNEKFETVGEALKMLGRMCLLTFRTICKFVKFCGGKWVFIKVLLQN